MAFSDTRRKTLVVGAGPVGSLAALYAAKRGDAVEIYELRGDLRDSNTIPLNFTKSINLALSERGINAIRHAQRPGLIESILLETIPMYGRMIHGIDANGIQYEASQAYDVSGKAINAVDRGGLNTRLLDELERMPNVKFFFNHRLTGMDLKRNLAWFEQQNTAKKPGSTHRDVEIQVSFDFLIGADGAHSATRYHLMKFVRINYCQEYIDTLWCEFTIPPLPEQLGGGFRLSPNHLHIWPGGDFMFIAIPSLDKSFTCTLFLDAHEFARLESTSQSKDRDHPIVEFFQQHFPGVVPEVIAPSALISQFKMNPHLPLISIKCTPYHYGSSCVIVGDAAHAMLPFYGQGMNAGLEDVRILYSFLDTLPTEEALASYTKHRTPDAHAINDLADRNYLEMRSSVKSPAYRIRKWIEEVISIYLPASGWSTQYSRISFGNERYSDVEAAVQKQGRALAYGGIFIGLIGLGAGLSLLGGNRGRSTLLSLF